VLPTEYKQVTLYKCPEHRYGSVPSLQEVMKLVMTNVHSEALPILSLWFPTASEYDFRSEETKLFLNVLKFYSDVRKIGKFLKDLELYVLPPFRKFYKKIFYICLFNLFLLNKIWGLKYINTVCWHAQLTCSLSSLWITMHIFVRWPRAHQNKRSITMHLTAIFTESHIFCANQ